MTLHDKILKVLEQHDGICLDNEEEREKLTKALAIMLIVEYGMRPAPCCDAFGVEMDDQ